ncbi:MAG: lipid IV(A) 3-deoxy-D-manno-octulosonic acid transferase [Gammaproteobacteria bacterium]|nr:lipid IV(A) 3-deoxy-D-manno-octulosonic acid transferase [Gammaproteobacteria bacterium]
MLLRFAYNVLLCLALPVVWLRLFVRARREPAYAERRGERFGRVPAHIGRDVVWFHTVSAGETIGAAPVIRALKSRLPDTRFLVTTMTPAGSAQVIERLGDIVDHCYAPYDFPWAVRRFVRRVRPRALFLMETELWPNLIAATHATGAPVSLINARLSERSARGYRRIGPWTRQTLGQVAQVICQYDDTARRFEELGVARERLAVTGSIKFDLAMPDDLDEEVRRLREAWVGDRRAWIAGSTHPGEDEIVLDAHRALIERFPGLLLILAPRHPARADRLAVLARERGLHPAVLSAGPGGDARSPDVLVVDAMGRLIYLYGIADAAFLGGSLVPVGGHNPIEAAVHGIPLLMGPHRFNWTEIVRRFSDAKCLHRASPARLAVTVGDLLADDARRRAEGWRARSVVQENQGVTGELVARMLSAL